MSCWRKPCPAWEAPLATTPSWGWKPSAWCPGPTLTPKDQRETCRTTPRWLSSWCRGLLNCKHLAQFDLVLDVLRQQELETYALTDLVPAIGGYLGLFIGFSCLGFFDFLCQFFGIIYNECTQWYQQLYRPCNPKWNWGANLCRIYDFILNVNLSEFEFRFCTKEEDSKVLWKDWLGVVVDQIWYFQLNLIFE